MERTPVSGEYRGYEVYCYAAVLRGSISDI